MEEQEIKRLLKETEEGPSYGFSQKTMRKIVQLEARKSVFGVKGHKSKIVIIIPFILAVLMLSSLLFLDPQFKAFNQTYIWLNKFQSLFVVNYFWLPSALLIVTGFWSWILWEKRLQKRT